MKIILTTIILLLPMFAMAGEWYEIKPPDQSDWSENRKKTYAKFQEQLPEAIISVDSLGIEAQVFSDSIRDALEGGVSHVSGTARPGETGNMAIAGHRDGFFRRLEDIPIGTEISVTTENHTYTYQVTDISIVDALDISVLDDTGENVLTLITCHPFEYQGYAPDRYIVRAVPREALIKGEENER